MGISMCSILAPKRGSALTFGISRGFCVQAELQVGLLGLRHSLDRLIPPLCFLWLTVIAHHSRETNRDNSGACR